MSGNALLDTNIVVEHFRNPEITAKLREYNLLYMPAIVLGELYYGAFKAQNPQVKLTQLSQFTKGVILLSVDPHTAEYFGRIKARRNCKETARPFLNTTSGYPPWPNNISCPS